VHGPLCAAKNKLGFGKFFKFASLPMFLLRNRRFLRGVYNLFNQKAGIFETRAEAKGNSLLSLPFMPFTFSVHFAFGSLGLRAWALLGGPGPRFKKKACGWLGFCPAKGGTNPNNARFH
jgi:hypothetical protein